MKVFVVIFHDIESGEILSVYATSKAANAAIREHKKQGGSTDVAWEFADIEEWQVQT